MNYQFALVILIFTTSLIQAKGPDFAREVLPILSDKCYACHGPDAKKKDIRLDTFEHATKVFDGYKAIDPDDPEESEVIYRMFDEDDPMPPKMPRSNSQRRTRDNSMDQERCEVRKTWAYVHLKR